MRNLKEFHYPSQLRDALNILRRKKARPLAGGTNLVFQRDPSIQALVSLAGLGLSYVRERKDEYTIGSMTTINEFLESPLAPSISAGVLVEAARSIGSSNIRNAVTFGGNIVGVAPWSCLPAPLLACGARIVVVGSRTRELPAEKFFNNRPTSFLRKDEIVKEILIPRLGKNERIAHQIFKITSTDYMVAQAVTWVAFEGKNVREARIVVGGLGNLPQRAYPAEENISGRELTPELIEETAILASRNLQYARDIRFSKEYKTGLVEVLVKRALTVASR